eukprot:TRINITY_DN86675_c0_g1_i1.p1 TRINITY_DN86675_c0_g1~~TRINITY_DN86675_c0_g1_i1.p1  ORF type:complete len:113 (+),score=13.52 TRINITY_DN86675_c0_g1_i1:39-377(+)
MSQPTIKKTFELTKRLKQMMEFTREHWDTTHESGNAKPMCLSAFSWWMSEDSLKSHFEWEQEDGCRRTDHPVTWLAVLGALAAAFFISTVVIGHRLYQMNGGRSGYFAGTIS